MLVLHCAQKRLKYSDLFKRDQIEAKQDFSTGYLQILLPRLYIVLYFILHMCRQLQVISRTTKYHLPNDRSI